MKIAVIQTRPGIGDFCIFLPFIHMISKYYNSKVILITKKRTFARELTLADPFLEKVIYIDERNNSKDLYNNLKFEKCDYVFIFHFSIRYYLISVLSGARKVFHYGFFKKKVGIISYPVLMMHNWLGRKLEKNLACNLFFNNSEKIDNKNNIILGIGGSGKNKKWDIQNYISIVNKIDLTSNQIIIAGGNEEILDAQNIIRINPDKIISMCSLSLPDTIKFIRGSKLYLGNDTGFMHLSAAMGVKSYGLFGDTPVDYTSYNNLIIPITPKNKKNITYNDRMMDEIYPDDVFEFIKNDI